ncbi:Intracellular distribution of mitochondria [Coemansia sp. RSA 1813]|nr:Intracellular distribution of mitochondria [Coemansia sp. RSA 1646]KAJ1772526.1 Intracellular distribution of mitochondria [Coemansia sp. RSA 1843]KAJ2090929.1 Intracellular distribution of mitochondria [Coemansia sp. RSA 986]KAJ2214003.1 Intracellular distribution of mitochondria [Coemansia sp. RSA 487]KAJ2571244.1 Intracellular distribution of mitochondria [Coemansia sp. RSA 1813]
MSTPDIKITEPAADSAPNVTGSVSAAPSTEDGTVPSAQQEISPEEQPYNLTIKTPNGATVPIIATTLETIQDLKQVVSETPATIEYSCFYLALDGQRLNDFAELGEIEGLEKDSQLLVVEDQYTEREARLHVNRLRDLLVGPATANSTVAGLDAGASIFSTIKYPDGIVDDSSANLSAAAAADAVAATGTDGSESESTPSRPKAAASENVNGTDKQKTKKSGKKAQSALDGKKKSDDTEQASGSEGDKAKPAPVNHALKGFDFDKVSRFETLSTSKALKNMTLPTCLKQIILSGWNPVPRYRQLKGDLLYLLVTTLENQNYHITCSRTGFYVNSSSLVRFNPEPYGTSHAGAKSPDFYEAHSLITLLTRLSPKFVQGLEDLQKQVSQREPVEVLPFVSSEQAASPWLVRDAENRAPETYDMGRAQEVYLKLGAQAADSMRDWNEELQSIREMPRGNLSERVLRDRQFHKWYSEFAEAAVQGAIAVVESELPPLNPTDSSDQHMFLRDNIFYSKGFDGRETFTDLGGDAAAHVATGKDIHGVRLLNQLDVEGVNTLGSVVVDYRGVRVVAQSVVPGIFRRQDTTQIVYGSVDNGATVGSDPEFHKVMEPIAKGLHFGEHSVYDDAGEEHKLYTSADVKGLTGTDGRKYLLDLYRLTPVDVEFLENECEPSDAGMPVYPHKLVLLRPELVESFWETSVRKAVQKYAIEKSKTTEDKSEGNGKGKEKATEEPPKDGVSEKEAEEIKTREEESQQKDSADEDVMAGFEFSLELDPDAFTPFKKHDANGSLGAKEQNAMTQAVRDASKFLRETNIPAFARDLASYTASPLSGDALKASMHHRGINMRYLGKIASLLPADVDVVKNVRRLVIFEMISRAVKHIMRHLFRMTPAHLHAEVFALVAGALVGYRYCADPASFLSAEAKETPEIAVLTPEALAEKVREQVALRFRFDLSSDFVSTLVFGNERILLREICIKTGAQLVVRQYHFERPEESAVHAEIVSALPQGTKLTKPVKRAVKEQVDAILARPTTIVVNDVMNFVALSKVSVHNSSFADEAFEAGRMSLEQGQKELGLELLLESLALHEQTFGFLHSESARCYAVVSLAHYDTGEYQLAAEFMTKAVIISERTIGIDNPMTIHNYLNLGLYEHARGNTVVALRFMRHALDLWSIINSPDHPDLATAHNNIGVMLQSLRLYDDALRFFKSCLEIRIKLLGSEHVLVANAQHSLAKAYAIVGDFKMAVQSERDAHKYFNSKYGEEDPRTKETAEWMAELTFAAVRKAKLSAATRQKLREVAASNLMHMERDGKQQQEGARASGLLPIDDLLKYITGDSKPRPRGGRRGKGPKGSKR